MSFREPFRGPFSIETRATLLAYLGRSAHRTWRTRALRGHQIQRTIRLPSRSLDLRYVRLPEKSK